MKEHTGISNKSIFIIIISLALVVITGTFSWLSWRSQNTAMVLVVGDIKGLTVSLKPYQINGSLSPVNAYTDGISVEVTATNAKNEEDEFKLYYTIDTIDDELRDANFKYTITRCTANCSQASNYQLLNNAEGNFASAPSNGNLNIYNETVPANTTYKYKVYLWIDSAGGNQNNMQNKTFIGELRASVSFTPYSIISHNAVADNIASTYVTNSNGIQFNEVSSDTNGKGVYIMKNTENNAHPIYYYRGQIDNNNVLFGDNCWKMVRTTSTGGTKMVYTGDAQNTYNMITVPTSDFGITNDATYPFTYDEDTNKWTSTVHTASKSAQIAFTIQTPGDYIIDYTSFSESGYDVAYFYKGNDLLANSSANINGTLELNGLTAGDIIKVKYSKNGNTDWWSDNVIFSIGLKGNFIGKRCTRDTGIMRVKYNTEATSLADTGYMYGTRYARSSATGTGWYYAPDVTYENGVYTLSAKNGYAVETKSEINGTNINYQHYTCGSATETSCETVRYVFYILNDTTAYYITLSDGKKIEDALDEMFSNTNNSYVKAYVDSWFTSNMRKYTSYLEDTPWCNDRSIVDIGGWNPDGGDTSTYIRFGPYQRSYVTYSPSIACNKNDAFTVSENNGNGKLIYPVGLLTIDETMLAGSLAEENNQTFYLEYYRYYWLMSPDYFGYNNVHNFTIAGLGGLWHVPINYTRSIQPAISLKPGVKFSSGSGTRNDPYVVEIKD